MLGAVGGDVKAGAASRWLRPGHHDGRVSSRTGGFHVRERLTAVLHVIAAMLVKSRRSRQFPLPSGFP